MHDTRLHSVCATMKRFIDLTQTELARLRRQIHTAQRELEEARRRVPPNPDLVAAFESRLRELEQDRDNATNSLQVLQEEFSAQCL
jgi:chromosome segregation ATPase